MCIRKLLAQSSFLILNKQIVKKLGDLNCAGVLSFFIDKSNFFDGEDFYYTIDNLKEDTFLSERKIRECINKLLELNLLIDKGFKGVPAKRYFNLNDDEILALVDSPSKNNTPSPSNIKNDTSNPVKSNTSSPVKSARAIICKKEQIYKEQIYKEQNFKKTDFKNSNCLNENFPLSENENLNSKENLNNKESLNQNQTGYGVETLNYPLSDKKEIKQRIKLTDAIKTNKSEFNYADPQNYKTELEWWSALGGVGKQCKGKTITGLLYEHYLPYLKSKGVKITDCLIRNITEQLKPYSQRGQAIIVARAIRNGYTQLKPYATDPNDRTDPYIASNFLYQITYSGDLYFGGYLYRGV